MAIAESDIKRLWGKAAGRCSYPSCGVDCLPFLDLSDPIVIGEMAHVIARSTKGPRGKGVAGSNSYSNLILLCPTHHTLIDKAPTSNFPAKTLLQWKANHEARVESSLRSPLFPDRPSLAAFVRTRLTENRVCWETYGPESEAAKKNPLSTAAYLWPFRKFAIIVPNNRRIVCAIHTNAELFASDEYEIACRFVEHAEGFERNCTHPTENVPRFPTQFAEMFGE